MNYLHQQLNTLAVKIASLVIDAIRSELQHVTDDIVRIAKSIKPLPAYISVESPDGTTAVSSIVWLRPGEMCSSTISVFKDMPAGSVIKVNNPMIMEMIKIGNEHIINSKSDACMTCKTTVTLTPAISFSAIIRYPSL